MVHLHYRMIGAVTVLLATAALVPVASSSGAVGAGDGAIVDPPAFEWTYVHEPEPHYVGTLVYGRADFLMNDGSTLTTRAYAQGVGPFTIPGPTIRMTPGNKYVLRFHNLLDYEPPSTVHNDFKDPNITNVHTHGLHISGESPGDDVLRMFEGGRGGDYVYDIPADHMGGTFWYHAHHHGATYLQVSTGGFGLMIIDDSNDGIPADVAAMAERQVIIGYLDTNAAGIGGDALVSGTMLRGWTVNGQIEGTLYVPPNTWEHWRVLLADADARAKDVTIGAGCEAMLLARDGVWRTVAPKPLAANSVNLTGASRADLAVRCAGNSTIAVANQVVASIAVTGGGPMPGSPWANGVEGATWSADRPSYLRDLRGVTNLNVESISMGARTVNGSKFDVNTPTFTLQANQVQDWRIKGAVNHPFHLHVYHFQAQAGCPGDFEAGEYYDTIAGNCSVRFDLNAATSTVYSGMTIMHCHILDHEDQGAMTWMDVIGGLGPPTFPQGSGYGEYYPLAADPPAAPSELVATTVSSSTIGLSWTDNSSDETGFTVQRSLDGRTFAVVAETAAGVTTYSDTGLAAETTYRYRVQAVNAAGPSDWSNTAEATTSTDTGGPTSIAEPTVTVSTVSLPKGFKRGQATVVVVDDQGGPVEGATVTGAFSGSFIEDPVVGFTDAAGTVTFITIGSMKGGVNVTFCVTSVVAADLTTWTEDVCASV